MSVLTRYRKQYPGRTDPVIAQSILNCRLHAERVEPVSAAHINRVAIGPPRESMESDEFEVVAESSFIIEDVFNDQPRIDDIGGIGVQTRITSRKVIRIKDTSADSKRSQILPR